MPAHIGWRRIPSILPSTPRCCTTAAPRLLHTCQSRPPGDRYGCCCKAEGSKSFAQGPPRPHELAFCAKGKPLRPLSLARGRKKLAHSSTGITPRSCDPTRTAPVLSRKVAPSTLHPTYCPSAHVPRHCCCSADSVTPPTHAALQHHPLAGPMFDSPALPLALHLSLSVCPRLDLCSTLSYLTRMIEFCIRMQSNPFLVVILEVNIVF